MNKKLRDAVYDLVVAALDDNWGAMQQAQRGLNNLPTNRATLKDDLTAIFGEPRLGLHCLHCGLSQPSHDASSSKCMFDSTHFSPCDVQLSPAALQAALAGQWIASIKEMREVRNLGLKEAKDLMEGEFARHGWKKPKPY